MNEISANELYLVAADIVRKLYDFRAHEELSLLKILCDSATAKIRKETEDYVRKILNGEATE